MKADRRKRLERAGWTVGSAEDFLELTPEEAAYVNMKLALADGLRAARVRKRLTQTQLAKRLRSSQPRVAKMEAGDPSVTLDLLFRALLQLGVRPPGLAKLIVKRPTRRKAAKRTSRTKRRSAA